MEAKNNWEIPLKMNGNADELLGQPQKLSVWLPEMFCAFLRFFFFSFTILVVCKFFFRFCYDQWNLRKKKRSCFNRWLTVHTSYDLSWVCTVVGNRFGQPEDEHFDDNRVIFSRHYCSQRWGCHSTIKIFVLVNQWFLKIFFCSFFFFFAALHLDSIFIYLFFC